MIVRGFFSPHKSSSDPYPQQAVLDLQYHQFDSAGSAAAISVIRLGELFVTTSLGEHPRINFETLTEPEVVPLRCFAYAEVLGAVYTKGRRTIFDIAHLPDADDDAPTPGALPSGDARFETHLGLPVGILLCLAAVSNLSVQLDSLESDVVERRRDMIEAAIRQWRPSRIPGGEGSDSVSFLEEVRISEIWRQVRTCIRSTRTSLTCVVARPRSSTSSSRSTATALTTLSSATRSHKFCRSFNVTTPRSHSRSITPSPARFSQPPSSSRR